MKACAKKKHDLRTNDACNKCKCARLRLWSLAQGNHMSGTSVGVFTISAFFCELISVIEEMYLLLGCG